MTTKCVRLVLAVTGLALALGSVSACADDSTASAPITNNPVTTTSLYSAAPSTSASQGSTSEETTPSTPGGTSELPATEPNPSTKVPASFPGPSGQPLDQLRPQLRGHAGAEQHAADVVRQPVLHLAEQVEGDAAAVLGQHGEQLLRGHAAAERRRGQL